MKLRKFTTLAMLLALYVVLASIKPIKLSNFEFTFEGFVIILTAFVFSGYEAMTIAALGSLMYQIFFSGYPFTVTALLWIMPHVISALIVGLLVKTALGKLEKFSSFIIAFAMTISSTFFNTIAMYLDAYINQYSSAYVLVTLPTRIIVAIILAVVYGLLTPKLVRSLKKNR